MISLMDLFQIEKGLDQVWRINRRSGFYGHWRNVYATRNALDMVLELMYLSACLAELKHEDPRDLTLSDCTLSI